MMLAMVITCLSHEHYAGVVLRMERTDNRRVLSSLSTKRKKSVTCSIIVALNRTKMQMSLTGLARELPIN
jgi:hypothetical protein